MCADVTSLCGVELPLYSFSRVLERARVGVRLFVRVRLFVCT
jgi:hypothetical protein